MLHPAPRNARRSSRLLPIAVTLVSLALTLGIWVREQRNETEARQAAQAREIALISVELRDRLNSHALFLRSIRAFFASSPKVTPEQWRSFTRQLDIEHHAPGLEAYGYAQRANPDAAQAVYSALQREGRPRDFTKHLPAEFGAPFRLIHIAPLREHVQRGLGNDILSESHRRLAAEQARDTDDVALTGRTALRIDPSALPQPALLMMMPVYHAGTAPRTLSERRAAVVGLVTAAYRMNDLVGSLNAAHNSDLALRIFDDEGEGKGDDRDGLTLLFDSFPEADATAPPEERELLFGQRKWLLQFQPKSKPPLFGESTLLLTGGLTITLLLGLLTWNLATRRISAEAYARQINAELLHSEKRFQLVTQGTNDGLWDRDLASGHIYFSERLEQLVGYAPGTLPRDAGFLLSRIHPDDLPNVRAAGRRHLKERAPYDIEYRVLKADNRWRWFRARGQAVWDASGRAVRMAGSISDISPRKEAEAQLEHYKNFLSTVLRSIPLPVFVKDRDGRFIMGNAAMCEFTNSDERTLIGAREPANARQTPETQQKIHAMDERVFASGRTQTEEYALAIPGRGLRSVIARKTQAVAPDGAPIMIGTLTDVTEQREAERATSRSNRKLQAILDATTEVSIISTDTAGIIRTFNRGAEKMLAYRADEMIDRQSPTILHLESEIAQRGSELSTEFGHPVSGFAVFIAHPQRGGVERREWTYVRRDGSQLAVSLLVTAVHDESGEISGYLGIALDITERLRAEAELLRHRDHLRELVAEQTAELLYAKDAAEQASAAKSEFLANMSHELRTPMHAVLGFAELGQGKSRTAGPEKLQHYFERIRQSGERLLALLNDLLDLSKLEAGKMSVELARHDVLACLRDAAGELEPLLANRRQQLCIEEPSGATEAICDPVRLGQVFRNLLSNAIKFSPEDGRIVVRFAADTLPAGRRTGDDAALPALRITVSDDGPGIPPDELEAIFDKFMQSSKTKSGAGGTGLGLAICREILNAHRGTIRACNNPAGGASFIVQLPVIPNPLLASRSR
ncbi:MAG: hypothetical protein C0489_03070 [Candidatus Accumulibacter sp.]|nr:hypothetical protein [Accumulibacter sp.]